MIVEEMTVEEWKRKNPPIRRKPQTNADKIRAMTDEELSYYLDGLAGDGCPPQMSQVCNKKRYQCNVRKCWLDWLEQESYEYENNNW